jgi:hypothetical protein
MSFRQSQPASQLMMRLLFAFIFVIYALHAIAGSYPTRLSTKSDIQSANQDAKHIDIWHLPVEDYPLLSKFHQVYEIDLASREGVFATDAKMKALSELGFTNVAQIVLLNCRLITDKGIRYLARIPSLRGLGLEGTAITDAGCQEIASDMHLTSVDIANCPQITRKGIDALAASASLQEITFSADNLSQEEVLKVIASFKSVTWCEIVDLQHKLDWNAIRTTGAEKRIHTVVKATGALQDAYRTPD